MYGKEGRNSKYINNVMFKLELSFLSSLESLKTLHYTFNDPNLKDISNEIIVL